MTLEIDCAMCGKYKAIPVKTDGFDGTLDVEKIVKDCGWISQCNGKNFDIYCSEVCAK